MEKSGIGVKESNGAVLCDKWFKYGRCSRDGCDLQHRDAVEGDIIPLCTNFHRLKDGCADEECKLYHNGPFNRVRASVAQFCLPSAPPEGRTQRLDTRRTRNRAPVRNGRDTAINNRRGDLGYNRMPDNTIHANHRTARRHCNAGAYPTDSAQMEEREAIQTGRVLSDDEVSDDTKGGVSLRVCLPDLCGNPAPRTVFSVPGDRPYQSRGTGQSLNPATLSEPSPSRRGSGDDFGQAQPGAQRAGNWSASAGGTFLAKNYLARVTDHDQKVNPGIGWNDSPGAAARYPWDARDTRAASGDFPCSRRQWPQPVVRLPPPVAYPVGEWVQGQRDTIYMGSRADKVACGTTPGRGAPLRNGMQCLPARETAPFSANSPQGYTNQYLGSRVSIASGDSKDFGQRESGPAVSRLLYANGNKTPTGGRYTHADPNVARPYISGNHGCSYSLDCGGAPSRRTVINNGSPSSRTYPKGDLQSSNIPGGSRKRLHTGHHAVDLSFGRLERPTFLDGGPTDRAATRARPGLKSSHTSDRERFLPPINTAISGSERQITQDEPPQFGSIDGGVPLPPSPQNSQSSGSTSCRSSLASSPPPSSPPSTPEKIIKFKSQVLSDCKSAEIQGNIKKEADSAGPPEMTGPVNKDRRASAEHRLSKLSAVDKRILSTGEEWDWKSSAANITDDEWNGGAPLSQEGIASAEATHKPGTEALRIVEQGRSARRGKGTKRDGRVKEVAGRDRVGPAEVQQDSAGLPAGSDIFRKYFARGCRGIKKLPEEILYTIFSMAADGVGPDQQTPVKDVRLNSGGFEANVTFNMIRFHGLRGVLRTCYFWRFLGQQIMCKYVALNQYDRVERFSRTVSKDTSLGQMARVIRINVPPFIGRGYKNYDKRIGFKSGPSPAESAHLFRDLMENCSNVQILSVHMPNCTVGFGGLAGNTRFPEMREIQLRDSINKGPVDSSIWGNLLNNFPNLEKLIVLQTTDAASRDTSAFRVPRGLGNMGDAVFKLRHLTLERSLDVSDAVLLALSEKLHNLADLAILNCPLVSSSGLARFLEKIPNQLTRFVYIMWISIYGQPSDAEKATSGLDLCHALHDHCQTVEYLNLKPYRVCGDLWKESNFKSLAASCVQPMFYYDCGRKTNLGSPTLFLKEYEQAREEGRLPALAEEKSMIGIYK